MTSRISHRMFPQTMVCLPDFVSQHDYVETFSFRRMTSSIEELFHEHSKVKGTSNTGDSRSIATGATYLPELSNGPKMT